jgi:hypothetical protein
MKIKTCLELAKIAVLSLVLVFARAKSIQGKESLQPLPSAESLEATGVLDTAVSLAVLYHQPVTSEQLRRSVDMWAEDHTDYLGILDWMHQSYGRVKAIHKVSTVRPMLVQVEHTSFNSRRMAPGMETSSYLERPKRLANIDEFFAERKHPTSVDVGTSRYGSVLVSNRVVERGGFSSHWDGDLASRITINVSWECVNDADGKSQATTDEATFTWRNLTWNLDKK